MLQARDGLRALSGRRVAVVGAGPGGLATALLLARAGIHVTLFEKDGQVGGRTKTVEAPGGYKFDIGPTFFLYPQILADIFSSCGERLEDHVKLERLDPQYHLVFEGEGASPARSAPPATSTGWRRRSQGSPPTMPRTSRNSSPKIGRSSNSSSRCWSSRSTASSAWRARRCWPPCPTCTPAAALTGT
ncbi:FAD-dependent oxidoreductase [Methylobacterium persicinum]